MFWWFVLMLAGGYVLGVLAFFVTLFNARGPEDSVLMHSFSICALVVWAWICFVFWLSPMEVTW